VGEKAKTEENAGIWGDGACLLLLSFLRRTEKREPSSVYRIYFMNRATLPAEA